MKRILAAILVIVLMVGACQTGLFSITANASTITSGDDGLLNWVLDDEGTLTIASISGNAYMADYSSTSMPWYRSRDSIKNVVIKDGVLSIGRNAFYKCTNLTNVTFGNSITEIGGYAFYSCSSLDAITIPDSVTEIGDFAFYNCKNLTNATFGNSITEIGGYAFYSCSSLDAITIPDSVTSIGRNAFYDTAYYNNSKNWEEGILYLGSYLINAKSNLLGSCIVKDGVKRIASGAFYNCKNITSIIIPNSVIAIDESGLEGCSNLESITLPFVGASRTVSYAWAAVFGYIFGLTSNDTEGATYQYSDGNIDHYYNIPSTLKTVKITDTTHIPERAFYNCKNITSIMIPHSVKSIDDSAFYNCSKLADVYYTSTIDEKKLISISRYKNDYLTDATWHYNYCLHGVEHLYDDCYDTFCESCGETRTITHEYEWVVDIKETCGSIGVRHEECTICYTKRNENTLIDATGNHSYDNDCDAICNVCEQLRKAPHVFADSNDNECNLCKQGVVLLEFDSNGGTSIEHIRAISSQPTILPVTIPTKSGYNFKGWATTKNGDVKYYSNDMICVDKNTTLYAQWNKHCDICSGTGRSICSSCSGSGEVKEHAICQTCFGGLHMCSLCTKWLYLTGEQISERSYFKDYQAGGIWDGQESWGYDCPYCGNFGTVGDDARWAFVRCYSCYATGYEDVFYSCDNCFGNGDVKCTTCDGVGEVIRKNAPAPATPILESVTSSRIVLQAISNGEYSYDGIIWQDSPIFENLEVNQEYNFYQRYAKTDTTYASAPSVALKVVTHNHTYTNACDINCNICGYIRAVPEHNYILNENHTCDICKHSKTPDKPIIESTTSNSVTLVQMEGFEYSKDGTTWQSSNVFTNLSPNTTYIFYQRVQESETAFVSSMSQGMSVILQPNIVATGICGLYGDNVTWQLDLNGTLTLFGTGKMADYSIVEKGPYAEYDFNTLIVSEAVTNIGEWAFYGCSSLERIQFSNSITHIGNYAFDGCSSLTSVQFSDSITYIGNSAFYKCSGLKDINLPSNLRSVGNYAFYGCVGLENIDITNGVSDIGSYAFSGCKSLTSIEIPDSVSSIGDCILSGCSGLTYIKVPFIGSSVTTNKTLGYLFDYNVPKSLKRVKLGEACKSIGDSAFEDCRSLTSIEIPNSVKTIGEKAFWRCEGLTSIEIPDSVTSIGYAAFESCDLEEVKLSSNLASIPSSLFKFCNKLTRIEIPASVTSIGNYAFAYCSSLASVEIPHKVSKIGYWAFAGCDRLTDIKIPDGVQTLETSIFSGCNNLERIEIPRSLTNIGYQAVFDCNNLTMIRYRGPEADSKNIVIDEGNERLKEITWYYDMCEGEHIYETCDDITCGQCLYIREPVSHLFTLNMGLTCEHCGYSKKPEKPQLESKTWNKIVLVSNDIFEYSMDGVTWQNSSAFSGLLGDKTYTFYQRVKQSTIAKASESSEVLTIYLKGTQESPSSPIVSSFTDTRVTLLQIPNGEYSQDGINWQKSNAFENLLPNTTYTFVQRYAETDTHEASATSTGTSVTTDKSKQTLVPAAPTVQGVTSSSITLVAIEGCEYSKNGTTWQESNVFSGLSCGTEYTFYQRYKETNSTYAGKSSERGSGKTDKGTQSSPLKPTLFEKTHTSVTLTAYSGYEYSMDGINWQTSNVFSNLNPETNYLFYQRQAENERYYASNASSSLTVKTNEEPQYVTGDLNNDEVVTDADALYLLYHTIFEDTYPIEQDCDYNLDGSVTDADALYLLYHTIFDESYPLN